MSVVAGTSATLAGSDHIVALDNGRVAEQGTHKELMKLGGLYKEIYQREKLGEELRGREG